MNYQIKLWLEEEGYAKFKEFVHHNIETMLNARRFRQDKSTWKNVY